MENINLILFYYPIRSMRSSRLYHKIGLTKINVTSEVQGGVNVEQAYATLLKGKKGQTVIVAVIDSGVLILNMKI